MHYTVYINPLIMPFHFSMNYKVIPSEQLLCRLENTSGCPQFVNLGKQLAISMINYNNTQFFYIKRIFNIKVIFDCLNCLLISTLKYSRNSGCDHLLSATSLLSYQFSKIPKVSNLNHYI